MELTIASAELAGKILDRWITLKDDKWNHPKLPLRVGRNLRKINAELADYNDRYKKVVEADIVRDENGKPVTKKEKNAEGAEVDTGIPTFKDEKALNELIAKMREETIEVDIHPIPESWFEKDPPPSLLAIHADFLIIEEE